jgi:phosphoribosyl 1,2-cyclic phosphodiesterase
MTFISYLGKLTWIHLRTIVIDVGKNFQAAAIEFFPKYGLRRIDAVILSHPHADAMNGLDDLRGSVTCIELAGDSELAYRLDS